MAVQNERPGTFPAEGRPDVAADLEEEQRNAYSAHHVKSASQGKGSARKAQAQQTEQDQPEDAAFLYPVEGRDDVAADVEEEERNAYSAHRT